MKSADHSSQISPFDGQKKSTKPSEVNLSLYLCFELLKLAARSLIMADTSLRDS
jgi:hypothetical protein